VSAFIHCPDCQCAYDAARGRGCPRCGAALGEPGDFGARVIEAADHLAGLLAGAGEADLEALRRALDRELEAGAGDTWRRPLLEAIQTRAAPAALVPVRAELATLDSQRTAASAALLFAVVSRLAQLTRPAPTTRRSLGRRALGLARRAFSAIAPA
jgi:hypothetical protein